MSNSGGGCCLEASKTKEVQVSYLQTVWSPLMCCLCGVGRQSAHALPLLEVFATCGEIYAFTVIHKLKVILFLDAENEDTKLSLHVAKFSCVTKSWIWTVSTLVLLVRTYVRAVVVWEHFPRYEFYLNKIISLYCKLPDRVNKLKATHKLILPATESLIW